jgi:membrane protein
MSPSTAPSSDAHGRQAGTPARVPARGWRDIAVRTAREAKADDVALLGAGVAFYWLLALVPALTAIAGIYGLVVDPAEAGSSVDEVLAAAPAEVRDLVSHQLEEIAARSQGQAGFAAAAGIVLALWSASSGMRHLVGALNLAYDEEERRSFLRLRALSLLLTVGAGVFLTASVAVIAVAPAAVADTGAGEPARVLVSFLRWPVLALAMVGMLAVLYRYGPDRDEPRWEWAGVGSVAATVLWLLGSGLFSLYTANFGRYDDTYGSLGAIVVAMLWLLLTAVAVVLGAELNAESERQTARDTTEGPSRSLGERDAHAADTVGPTAEELKGEPAGHR